jgi:PAS domain S-box-containing protein
MSARKLSLSTGQTLSILTTAVVVAVLAVGIAATWATVRLSALENAQDRMTRGVNQLAAVSATGVRTTQQRYAAVASDPAIRRALAATPSSSDLASVKKALTTLQAPSDSGLPVALWRTRDRQRVAFVGNDVASNAALNVGGEGPAIASVVRPPLDSISGQDSLQVSAMFGSGAHSYVWIAEPVMDSGRTLGFVIKQSRVGANQQIERTLRELVGDSVAGYYRNIDGTSWTTLGGSRIAPPEMSATDTTLRTRANTGKVIFAEQRIAGTPLILAMEVPERIVLADATRLVRQLGILSVLLALVGGVLAWMVGGRAARPIVAITDASDAVARGDYKARVSASGSREVARLAATFNRMAEQIGDSHVELERREQELRALADAIPQLAWMADSEGRIFWFNERWYEYTGFATTDAHHLQWMNAHDPAFFTSVESRWNDSVRAGQPFEMEVKLRDFDGSSRWFLTRVAPVSAGNGSVARWFGTSTDVQALREARDAAEGASKAKSEFLASMSHELRTPLNAIGGYTELMEMGIRGPITQEQRRDLSRIRMSQEHLLGLIASLLDLSRIESGNVHYAIASVAVGPVFADIEALIAPQAAAKEQLVTFEHPESELVVLADREKLRQILLNLLSNAIRHTPSGTSIAVRARRVEPSAVQIVVVDTGPGIAPEMHQSIFEPFVQLDRSLTNGTQHGVGLGLAISRDLARGMNGELTIASEPGKGSSFALTLPVGVWDATTVFMRTMEMPIGGPIR